MSTVKIAILGASGVGRFHAREFMHANADVVAILGTSRESAEKTADSLHGAFGIRPRAYAELDELIERERISAVSICTPPELHYEQVKRCLAAGLHVLCEKPFVLNAPTGNASYAAELVEMAKRTGRIVTVNTQWPAILPSIEKFVDISNVKDFSMHSQPGARGMGMLLDHLPHANSILVRLIPDGRTDDIQFSLDSDERIGVDFIYGNGSLSSAAHYRFSFKADRPRDIGFSFNAIEFKRKLGEQHQQKLVTGATVFDIQDPFGVSIGKFVGALQGRDTPLISEKELLENVQLQDTIVAEYMSVLREPSKHSTLS